jgi:GT2 family glycosyltransferase
MPLNPDVRLTPTYLSELFQVMESQELAGSVVGKLMFMKENGEITDQIYSTGHLLTKSRSPTNRGYKEADTGKYERQESIFAANGAAPLYRREMFEDISLDGEYFCEDFFIYGEDHDLGWRAQLRGWKCIYNPKALAFHIGFGSGGINDFHIQIQFSRNRYLTLVRNDDLFSFTVDLPFILVYEFVLQLYWLFRSPGRILAHWIGIIQVFTSFMQNYRARKYIQGRRKVSRSYIRSFFVSQLW